MYPAHRSAYDWWGAQGIMQEGITRRDVLRAGTLAAAAWNLEAAESAYDWAPGARILIAEAYNPPFYPSLDYEPEKAVRIARELSADGFRYPAASYYCYFPNK